MEGNYRSNSEGGNFSAVVPLLRQAESLLSSQVHRNAATVSPPSVEASIRGAGMTKW